MIDDISLGELIQQQIGATVKDKVNALVNDREWFERLEHEIIVAIQQRIVTRFSNVETVPDLVKTVEHSVEQLFLQGRIPGFDSFIDMSRIEHAINNSVKEMIQHSIDNLVVDSGWIARVETMVNHAMTARLTAKMAEIDLNRLLVEQIDAGIERWQDRFKENFATRGIQDRASSTQLTVLDGVVVAEEDLVSKGLSVETNAEIKGALTVNDLILRGRVNLDNASWSELTAMVADRVLAKNTADWQQTLVADVLEAAKTDGIDFDAVTLRGRPLIDGNQLNSTITDTNIEKTGTLRQLTVSGETRLAGTATVKNRRVGINTDDPEMALSIWDEEVAVVLGKKSERTAYIGTARAQDLSIGVNRKTAVHIDAEGLTTIQQLRVDRFKLGHATEVPGYSGTRGDLVFNSDPKPNTAFAWVCLGGFKWQPLRSA